MEPDTVKESKSSSSEQEEEKNNNDESLSDRFQRAISLIESSPEKAVSLFTNLQEQSANLSLFSSNESFNEISTGSLPFLALEHYLAISLSRVGTPPDSMMKRRRNNVQRACDLWGVFLDRLDKLEQLKPEEKSQYTDLIELSSRTDDDDNNNSAQQMMPPPVNRDVKIARFRSKQVAEKERDRLKSLFERRNRLGVADDDEMDGYDHDSLSRSVAKTTLDICKAEALDEFSSAIRELPMIAMMVKAEEERQCQDRHKGGKSTNPNGGLQDARPPPPPQKPLQLTHITQDSTTGQLNVRREEVRGNVFKRGWNQPTMTLEELAERETADAIARDQRQKEAEAANMGAPRRYDQLKKDEMEDNTDLVDASAVLDRQWDDWKDENPRGSGNKRGDVGDRNF